MKIAKPLLLDATPIGVAGGVYEACRLAGGLVFLMHGFERHLKGRSPAG